MRIGIINGPNLNWLGRRQPELYGSRTWDDFQQSLLQEFSSCSISCEQSNDEGALVSLVQEWGLSMDALIINAGAYTHTSVALADAVAMLSCPTLEVHLSQVAARETFRQHSYLAPVVRGTITGLGLEGYRLAVQYLLHLDATEGNGFQQTTK